MAFIGDWFLGISNWFVALSNWRRVIWLAMCQVFMSFSRRGTLGFLWMLAEPLVAVMVIYAIRGLLKMNTPNYGSSLFLFYATGFLPFYLFVILSSRARTAGGGFGGRLPGLSGLDAFIASILVYGLIWIIMIMAIFLGMWWLFGIREAGNVSLSVCAAPIGLLVLLAMGVGMINSAIMRYFAFWAVLYGVFTRGLVFMSGVMQIVDLQPLMFRQFSILNPLSHAIEWFRIGVWERYPHNSLDKDYLIMWVIVVLVLGIVVDRATLRKLGGNISRAS